MELTLLRGEITLIDDSDAEWASKYQWRLSHQGYAVRSEQTKAGYREVSIARELLNAPSGFEVDHINRDRLDNRRCNLRLVTKQQNQMNRSKLSGTTSRFIGVYIHRGRKKMWDSRITIGGRIIWLGSYYDETEAALAYDNMAKKMKGEYANLNFPQGVTNATT